MYALVDCNNFYASCERVFNPSLINKPVIVLSNNDGCVIARSNEVKKIGIKMGEPAFKIKPLIKKHDIKIFSTNFALYGDMSKRVMNTIVNIIPDIEIYSIDEAFLDLTQFKKDNLLELLDSLRKKIFQDTGIPVSIGIAKTKTLSKIASYIAKKEDKHNGVFILDESNQHKILNEFAIENIWGVGSKTKNFLKSYNIHTAGQLKNSSIDWIHRHKSIVEVRIIKELRGIICYKIDFSISSKKSICTSRTFGQEVTSFNELRDAISMYTARCAEKLRFQKSCAMLVHIFISTNPFQTHNQHRACNSIKLPVATNDTSEILSYVISSLGKMYKKGCKYKKAGIIVSGIIPACEVQSNLFDNLDRMKSQKIMTTIDSINRKNGRDSIRYASQGYYKKIKLKQECLSPCYTTRWADLLIINVSDNSHGL